MVALFLLMGGFSSGFAQVGSVTINGNQNVVGGSTWTYSIIGTSCSSATWIVNGGTITSQNNISVTVQWNNTSGNGSVQVSSYGCSPTPENRTGSLSVTRTNVCTHIAEFLGNIGGGGEVYSRQLTIGHTYSITLTWVVNGISYSSTKSFVANSIANYTPFPEVPIPRDSRPVACITNLTASSCATTCL